jgi:uncharacterized lipoprotein YmbA
VRRAVLCLSAFLAACAISAPPPQRFYRLDVPPPPIAPSAGPSVAVAPVQAFGIYAERPLIYRPGADAPLEQYHYSLWAEPPAVMLESALVGYLRAALGAARLAGANRADYTVRARLRRLEHILAQPPRAVVAIDFAVMDGAGAVREIVEFSAEEAARGGALTDHVAALNVLLGRAFARVAEHLAAPRQGATVEIEKRTGPSAQDALPSSSSVR